MDLYEIDPENLGRLYMRTDSGRILMNTYSKEACRSMPHYRSLVGRARDRLERDMDRLENSYYRVNNLRPCAIFEFFSGTPFKLCAALDRINRRIQDKERLVALLDAEEALLVARDRREQVPLQQ